MEVDEIEIVNRRDAVAGLGLLSVLLAALVGTIVFRIANPSPATTVSVHELALAPERGRADAPLASRPPAVPSSETLKRDGNVSSAAFRTSSGSPGNAATTQPTFVAPAAR